jgi:hypothetical protein
VFCGRVVCLDLLRLAQPGAARRSFVVRGDLSRSCSFSFGLVSQVSRVYSCVSVVVTESLDSFIFLVVLL